MIFDNVRNIRARVMNAIVYRLHRPEIWRGRIGRVIVDGIVVMIARKGYLLLLLHGREMLMLLLLLLLLHFRVGRRGGRGFGK